MTAEGDKRGITATHWVVGASISTSGRKERTRMDATLTSSSLPMRPHKQDAHPMTLDDVLTYGNCAAAGRAVCCEEEKRLPGQNGRKPQINE